MINVDRSKIKKPEVLDKKDQNGLTETDRAINFYSDPINLDEPFNYKIYSDPKVKESLIELFKGKCAYCESKFLHVYSGDIEHFRPKGKIEEASPQKPGYYWLAADWDNLYLSCRNCNQTLKHDVFGTTGRITLGKLNQFPLTDPTRYVRKHNHRYGISSEDQHRLLIDPCKDTPEKHLEFIDEGVIKDLDDRGKTSIKVYALQRVPLVQSREKKQIEINAQIQRVKEAILNYDNNLNTNEGANSFYFEKILHREMLYLKKYMNDDEEYAGMAKQMINKFMSENFLKTKPK